MNREQFEAIDKAIEQLRGIHGNEILQTQPHNLPGHTALSEEGPKNLPCETCGIINAAEYARAELGGVVID
jgi:hypothetical protein